MKQEYLDLYKRWQECAVADKDLTAELKEMAGNEAAIEDAFYCDLSFGTAGLRGVLGAGTNRMNCYVVARATRGLAAYVKKHFPEGKRSVAIGYDSRIKSDVFARIAAAVMAEEGVKAYLWPTLMPVPCVSFATRELNCSAGIMVTASHNPSKYNGYKAYGADGCQLGEEEAAEVLSFINALDLFENYHPDFEAGLASGMIEYIGDKVYDAYIATVKSQSLLGSEKIDRDVAIVYTPLNGAGLKPVTRVLRETGFTNIKVVKEQEQPDGHFPTCPFPNPEIREAMQLGMEYARREQADLLIATDPDSDRVGIAVRDGEDYRLITGNQVGVLLVEYICSRRIALGKMPKPAYITKSIVTTDLSDKVAAGYGVEALNVLTGFKYTGEQIARLESLGRRESFLLGFEESYGYLIGTHARDKDAVVATMMIAEMFAFYRTQGVSLPDKLNEIYGRYGYCLNHTFSFVFEGSAGFAKMQEIMSKLHKEWGDGASATACAGSDATVCAAAGASSVPAGATFLGYPVEKVQDFLGNKVEGMAPGTPKSNMLRFVFKDGNSAIVRPSGTEPKLKVYATVYASSEAEAVAKRDEIGLRAAEMMK